MTLLGFEAQESSPWHPVWELKIYPVNKSTSNLWTLLPKWWNQMICLPYCYPVRLTISQPSTVQVVLCFQQNWTWRFQSISGSDKWSFSVGSKIGLLLWVEFRDIMSYISDIFTHSVAAETLMTTTEAVFVLLVISVATVLFALSSWVLSKFLRFLCSRSSSAFIPSITSFRSWTET